MDELREGYKNIKGIGWIPEEWEVKKLGDIIDKLETGVSVNSEEREKSENEFGILKTSSVSYGKFTPKQHKTILTKELDRAKINPKKDSILISRMNTPELVGASVYISKDYNDLFLPDRLWQTIIKKNVDINVKWLYYILNSDKVKYKLSNIATGTSNSMKNISKSAFLNIKIPFSSGAEQEKISQIISTWDKAINKIEALIEEKKIIKKGLMQQFLTGKKRLKEFEDQEWKEVKLDNVLKFKKRQPLINPEKHYLLTVKLHLKGIEATNNKPNKTEKSRPYYLREPNELLIGRQNFHNGGIGIVPNEMIGYIASNAISSLEIKIGDLKFYYYYLSYDNFYKKIGHMIGGTGQKEISETMLKKLKLIIPLSLQEQKAIANILTTADKEIVLLEEKLEILKQQKKVLMQNLLTGKVRVKI
ncbi:hypothetical protein FDB55_15565 [Clostridium botulinum]|uniref:Type I restriction modification DNA specificity domain-containing protein n=1 Tax=Clostridium botulinum TaxID=1491 RepID=A0A6M0V388_CLOBO|nr:restriction endonuclease subunit S [Clostridium botulinum]MCS6112584.1 restriction endonuclease subunit S [Clostridium botulinum]NFE13093.1 hypothetical protein [Clostridium botulinum]NFE61235.1 hypothetical protein [Clostridium botulinum]NFF87296.1 hypothetical protein [Clostridium botulinum]NFG11343.1 hypothetical protein [Clostridium botulinum]